MALLTPGDLILPSPFWGKSISAAKGLLSGQFQSAPFLSLHPEPSGVLQGVACVSKSWPVDSLILPFRLCSSHLPLRPVGAGELCTFPTYSASLGLRWGGAGRGGSENQKSPQMETKPSTQWKLRFKTRVPQAGPALTVSKNPSVFKRPLLCLSADCGLQVLSEYRPTALPVHPGTDHLCHGS